MVCMFAGVRLRAGVNGRCGGSCCVGCAESLAKVPMRFVNFLFSWISSRSFASEFEGREGKGNGDDGRETEHASWQKGGKRD